MTREWAVFSVVTIAALMMTAILVIGATQGLFGFASASSDQFVATDPAPAAVESRTTYAVADAGFVTLDIDNDRLTVESVAPAAGWMVDEIERSSREIEVKLIGRGTAIEFAAALQNGTIVTFVETETTGGGADHDAYENHEEDDNDEYDA